MGIGMHQVSRCLGTSTIFRSYLKDKIIYIAKENVVEVQTHTLIASTTFKSKMFAHLIATYPE